ncbi:4336_t:CDS:1, partial [Paraglomus brasilianum]
LELNTIFESNEESEGESDEEYEEQEDKTDELSINEEFAIE